MKTVNIKEITSSSNVYGRPTGKNIRETFLEAYKNGNKINIDFKGIDTITHSFTDELIGVFVFIDGSNALKKLHFTNCTPDTQKMIEFVIKDRLAENSIKK